MKITPPLKHLLGCFALSFFILTPQAFPQFVDPGESLSYWLLPDKEEELPHHVEYDFNDVWKEIWVSEGYDEKPLFNALLEQSLGVKWAAFDPDKYGNPGEMILVFADKIVWLKKPDTIYGTIKSNTVTWAGGSTANFYELRRRGRRSRRRGGRPKRINFGKIVLPREVNREMTLSSWTASGLDHLLGSIANGRIDLQNVATVAKLSYLGQAGFLNFSFGESCSLVQRERLERLLIESLEPELNCLAGRSDKMRTRLLTLLLQKPRIECQVGPTMPTDSCGMATLPVRDGFFISRPTIYIPLNRCVGEEARTLLHETLHLLGLSHKSPDFDEGDQWANSCVNPAARPVHEFEAPENDFVNDFQVQARFSLFNAIRTLAESKWGWSSGEKAYVLGAICTQMSDSLCARRYFSEAAQAHLGGEFTLDDGATSTYFAASSFGLFDSIKEDKYRMRELLTYLKRDPQAALLRRREREGYKSHEYYLARSALEHIKENRNVCDEEIDEKIYCEDLGALVKTSWFLQH